jgi:hypothetical protein
LIVPREIQSAQIIFRAAATDLLPWQEKTDENDQRCANVYSSQHGGCSVVVNIRRSSRSGFAA